MASNDAPLLKEVMVEGTGEALQDEFGREGIEGSGRSSIEESLPHLLKIISTGNYSFIGCDSPDADSHSTVNISDLDCGNTSTILISKEHGTELNKDTDSLLYGASKVDISKLTPDNLKSTNQRTPRSGGILSPKSILAKRGGLPPTPRGVSSPRGIQAELAKKVSFSSGLRKGNVISPADGENAGNGKTTTNGDSPQAQQNSATHNPALKVLKRRFFSQPMPTTDKLVGAMCEKGSTYSGPIRRCTTNDSANTKKEENDADSAKTENYVMFRTKSNKLEKRLSRRQSRQSRQDDPSSSSKNGCDDGKAVPAGRYFDALKGPELEMVKDSEELLLPLNQKWPFLLRFPVGCFGICLGLGSQAMLWKSLAILPSMSFLKIPLAINLVLWCLAIGSLAVVSSIYFLKCLLYFEAVRREYYHPVRVNFFFAPWIACMFLALGIPPRIATTIHPAIWCIFTVPLFMLKLKIYGQWLSGGQRRLSKVANPSTHLALVGNFVSALLAAVVGWDEPAAFFWAVGFAHYLVVFVTLYQRLPTAEVLPKELHPVFFLFVAAPSVASVAWKTIVGSFDRVSRSAYFLALFLYASLVVRINFFCGFQFSITWWAYTFPMTASAVATIHYSIEVRHPITQGMAVILSCVSSVTVLSVFFSTLYHAIEGSLFPNDVAIAITRKRHKRKQKGLKSDSSSENKGEKCEDDSTERTEKGLKADPHSESKVEKCEDDVTNLYLSGDGGTIIASLQNGLISFTSDPFPVSAHATKENGVA